MGYDLSGYSRLRRASRNPRSCNIHCPSRIRGDLHGAQTPADKRHRPRHPHTEHKLMKQTRRDALKAVLLGAASTQAPTQPIVEPVQARARQSTAQAQLDHDMKGQRRVDWAKGFEGQRRADLGDGTYLNPIVAGDHPDPTVLKDGENYYMTFS